MPHSADPVQSPFAGQMRPQAGFIPGRGRVYLVGAGPGDPGLITVRGEQCLQKADVVLYDGLANPQLLELAPHAECICVGKHGQTPIWTQADINAKLVELAQTGRVVVRLKGGDPAVFARTAEELEALVEADVPFEVVPGITAALAAASYVGIPLTHREHASAVAFVTGQQQTASEPQPIDWEALARFPGTLVLYMGVTTAEQWTRELMSAGKDGTTPAAIVRHCTWRDQQVIRCQLQEVTQILNSPQPLRPPVIVLVGAVAALGQEFDWFSGRLLRGCGVLVTRPVGQADELLFPLRELGAEGYHLPVLEVVPPSDHSLLDAALKQVVSRAVDGITFSSSNGVDGFLRYLFQQGHDARRLAGLSLAVVGPATADRLRHYGLKADIVPAGERADYSAASLVHALGSSVSGQTWIVTTTNRTRPTMRAGLEQHGAKILEALSYETRPARELPLPIRGALEAGQIDFVTITSAAIADAAHELLGPWKEQVKPIALSEQVAEHLNRLAWPAVALAAQNRSAALVDAIVNQWQFSESHP